MSELEIPDAAYDAADAVLGNEHDMIKVAAPIIVAAAYRQLAKKYLQQAHNEPQDQRFLQACAGMLLDEANQLEQ
jgi:hypothetical protein